MRAAGGFVGLCALAIPGWWVALFFSPEVRQLFVPSAAWPAFQAVLLPDLALAATTLVVSGQLVRGRVVPEFFGVTWGAWAYATAYSIAWARSVEAPVIGPAVMLVALAGLTVVWYAMVPTRPSGRS